MNLLKTIFNSMFCIHVWTKYGDAVASTTSLNNKKQFRQCIKCGKIQGKSIMWTGAIPTSSINVSIPKLEG